MHISQNGKCGILVQLPDQTKTLVNPILIQILIIFPPEPALWTPQPEPAHGFSWPWGTPFFDVLSSQATLSSHFLTSGSSGFGSSSL